MADRNDIHTSPKEWNSVLASSAASLTLSHSSPSPLEAIPPSQSAKVAKDAKVAKGATPNTPPVRDVPSPNRPSSVRSVHYDDYPDDPEDYNLEVFNRLDSDSSRDREDEDEFDPYQADDWLAGTTSQTQHLRSISSSLEDLQSSIVTLCTRSSEQGRLLKSHSASVKKASAQLEDVWTALLRIVAQQDALQAQIAELRELVSRPPAGR